MSIASEITRLQTAKANIKTAINSKGGSLTNETLDQYASVIDTISTGTDISDANALVGDVLINKTFYATSGGKKTGTMADNGTVNTDITTKAQEVTIVGGKHSGSGKVKISSTEQAKIVADNIKSGVSILGQAGGLTPAKAEETKTITPNFSSGNIVVTPTTDKVMTQVTINKDGNLIASNIKSGVTIFGITGTVEAGGGYRPLVDSDIGKEFGVELDEKIYFVSDSYQVQGVFDGVLWGDLKNGVVMIDWVVPNASSNLELYSGVAIWDGEFKNNDIYLNGGNLPRERKIYNAYDNDDGSFLQAFYITGYTLPTQTYINNIYSELVKNFILVKDI